MARRRKRYRNGNGSFFKRYKYQFTGMAILLGLQISGIAGMMMDQVEKLTGVNMPGGE